MKLAFALFKYVAFGGMQKNMRAIARACVERGHQVTIYSGAQQRQRRGEPPEQVDLKLLPNPGISNHGQNASFARALAKAVAADPVDGLVGFNKMPGLDIYYAGDSCFAAKVYEDRSRFYRMTPRSRSSLAFERSVFARQSKTHILLLSKHEQVAFERYYQTPSTRFTQLPPGISRRCIMPDKHQLLRAEIRSTLKLEEEEILLLALGSGFKTKGLDRSIALLTSLSGSMRAKLVVVGEDKAAAFIRMAKKYQVEDRVQFLGGRKDVPALLQGADILLHPAYRENTGNVLLEAMVAGLPVVTTEVCGYAHYISDADMGIVLSSPFNPQQYTQSVGQLLMVPRAQWQQRGKGFAGNADIYERPTRAAEIIENLIGERSV